MSVYVCVCEFACRFSPLLCCCCSCILIAIIFTADFYVDFLWYVCVSVSYNGIYAPCYEWVHTHTHLHTDVHTQTRIVYPIRKLSAASASSDETQALPRHTPLPATHLPATCRWPKSHPQGLWLGPNERMNGLWYVQWVRVGVFRVVASLFLLLSSLGWRATLCRWFLISVRLFIAWAQKFQLRFMARNLPQSSRQHMKILFQLQFQMYSIAKSSQFCMEYPLNTLEDMQF